MNLSLRKALRKFLDVESLISANIKDQPPNMGKDILLQFLFNIATYMQFATHSEVSTSKSIHPQQRHFVQTSVKPLELFFA